MNKSRRSFLCRLGAGAIAIPLSTLISQRNALAAETPKLNPQEAPAKIRAYTHKSKSSSKTCAGCQFFTNAEAEWGPCVIFQGRLVSAKGVCNAWYARA